MVSIEGILCSASMRAGLGVAWRESRATPSSPHEEGGFIVQNTQGAMLIVRWPRGLSNTIEVPPHAGCKIDGWEIIASFHTHPNTGPEYLQEPSETDRRAVRGDPDLKAPHYLGELVISAAVLYLIAPEGSVTELGPTEGILSQA